MEEWGEHLKRNSSSLHTNVHLFFIAKPSIYLIFICPFCSWQAWWVHYCISALVQEMKDVCTFLVAKEHPPHAS